MSSSETSPASGAGAAGAAPAARISRRRFVKNSLAAGAVTAGVIGLGGRLLGADAGSAKPVAGSASKPAGSSAAAANAAALKNVAAAGHLPAWNATLAAKPLEKVRVGFIGVGGRGNGLLMNALVLPDVEIVAVCDLDLPRAKRCAAACKKRRPNAPVPAVYGGAGDAYKELIDREKPDAVVIATYWDSHAPIALYALERGAAPAVEVPIALTVAECWQLVETAERVGIPCMMLENWSFRRDNLAVLNMIRAGLFGEIVHSHCAHSHDCIDHWFFGRDGRDRWPAKYLINFNRDHYPTHSVGPVLSWLDINCGDVVTEIFSSATASKGINAYFARKFGAKHPGATRRYAQGDIVTSTLRTAGGKTFVINYDMQLPRPYSNRWLVQGTLGVYDEERGGIYLHGKTKGYHQWEKFSERENEHVHRWWREGGGGGHGGVDLIELREFFRAVKARAQTPIDVYDSVVMSAIVELSGQSIAANKPVAFPDFTKGRWKQRAPYFGV
ncbi:MAG: Gfo/Idh/MocA family oxidoreductase [Puniceicoccales bacterium]|jgi:predicted dehydrogenase|nr:Gfo/Idh/MocA family oxidoreductase [Puniceicoccales bacterium]